MDWDNVRIFLAVARAGQFVAAGRMLEIDRATVARRMTALERSLSARLFDRRTTGVALTAAGVRFLAAVGRVQLFPGTELRARTLRRAHRLPARERGRPGGSRAGRPGTRRAARFHHRPARRPRPGVAGPQGHPVLLSGGAKTRAASDDSARSTISSFPRSNTTARFFLRAGRLEAVPFKRPGRYRRRSIRDRSCRPRCLPHFVGRRRNRPSLVLGSGCRSSC